MSVAELVFQIGMPLEYHEGALPLQVTHEAGDADLGWDRDQHVYVVWHQVTFDDLDAFILAQTRQDFFETYPNLVVYDFPSELRGEDDMILAHPSRV